MDKLFGCVGIVLLGLVFLFALGSDDSTLIWIFLISIIVVTLLFLLIPLLSDNKTQNGSSTYSNNTIKTLSKTPHISSFSSSSHATQHKPYNADGKWDYPDNYHISTNNYDDIEDDENYPQNIKETLLVADEILEYSQRLEKDAAFRGELSKHEIEFNDENGDPLLGNGADVRRLFFIDIAHCYSEMNQNVDLNDIDGIGVLYTLTSLHDPGTDNNHSKDYLSLIREYTAEVFTRYVEAIAAAPVFHPDDDADFMVALVLLQYDHEQFCQYLTLLYRFCSLIAKGDGSISSKEQAFLSHIVQLRDNTPRSVGNVTTETNVVDRGGLAELDSLIGLASVKQEVHTMSNFVKVQMSRKHQGLKTTPISYHCVFTGNPGTGKTTVARIIAGIYAELEVLEKGHLVETDRSGLVAEFEGQTAVKTNKVIDRALGGVLFIDEAYSLVTGDQTDFGKEAIATLLKRMEDDRNRLVVILAGYGEEMKMFIDSNPGLQSRFNRYIHFPDYSADELYQIFCSLVNKYDYDLTPEASSTVHDYFSTLVEHKEKNFGNGRTVRNLFERTLERQANRLASISHPTLSQLKEIKKDDCTFS